jgi:hypothetical protein
MPPAVVETAAELEGQHKSGWMAQRLWKRDRGRLGWEGLLELPLDMTAEEALALCQRHGVSVVSERELAGRSGSRHWHLRIPGRSGTLELNEWQGAVWVKVHPLREGEWAMDFARGLAEL